MAILVFILLVVLLLFLNAFFVLAEFAAIKMRPTRVEELVGQGRARAVDVRDIQSKLDEYLAVCQLGITFASIGLGALGEKGTAQVLEGLGLRGGPAHSVATTVMVLLVSALHVILGEQVPKMFGLRRPEGSAMAVALPLKLFRWILYAPLVLLNSATAAVLAAMGLKDGDKEAHHSEEEIRLLLGQSQSGGAMSFRRLLLLENVFDLGGVLVREAMRPRDGVKVLRAGAPWDENLKVIRESRFSRFPLVDGDPDKPVGIVHVKDLLFEGPEKMAAADLRKIARAYTTARDDAPLENVMAELQKRRGHLALVNNAEGKWVGFVTLEDIIEEIIGTIEDEFEVEPSLHLADALTKGRIVLGLKAESLSEAIRQSFAALPAAEIPLPADRVLKAVLDREQQMSTYLGNGLAVPHARLEGLLRPTLLLARSDEGIPVRGGAERAHLMFILLTPTGSPRDQVRLLARICGLFDSDYVSGRLRGAATPEAVMEAVRAADTSTSH